MIRHILIALEIVLFRIGSVPQNLYCNVIPIQFRLCDKKKNNDFFFSVNAKRGYAGAYFSYLLVLG